MATSLRLRRRQLRRFIGVGDELQDCGTFIQNIAAIEFERRNVAIGAYVEKIFAAFGLLRLGVCFFNLESRAGFGERNMGRQRAGPGFVIKLHS